MTNFYKNSFRLTFFSTIYFHKKPSPIKRKQTKSKATSGIKIYSETRAETVRYTEKIEIMKKLVKTQKEIATEYGVCRSTFRKWLKPIENKLKLSRRPLLAWQVAMIYEFLDKPDPEVLGESL
ncbi:MAG: hypothetical protein A2W93_07650 [Bacteroidetes bacterium GWF2_43_63]|nr:MAG: hypothetical protein A2W94_09505 [Bacteroidetes bacterium GWE2_42_42]OFY53043.1 MAG: hypothetical protein A2W93_07650 [Bacteroidetes bacterium GWF2_43_63]HBG69194.1 hypothetical protein [Bacteroidales bacterium]HCB62535.1 hypothetical protein [Bacteroidales bacterium]